MISDDNNLLQALRDDDEKAMEMLFREYYQRLCNYANTILNDKDESEEAVQQLFIQLWEKRKTMEIRTSLQSYLFRSLRNSCLNKIKHQKVRQLYANETVALANNEEPSSSLTLHSELENQISVAIESLPEQCRLIFKMSRFEELKYSEIADQLGISVKTVENQMGKALRIMRDKLKDYLVIFLILYSFYL